MTDIFDKDFDEEYIQLDDLEQLTNKDRLKLVAEPPKDARATEAENSETNSETGSIDTLPSEPVDGTSTAFATVTTGAPTFNATSAEGISPHKDANETVNNAELSFFARLAQTATHNMRVSSLNLKLAGDTKLKRVEAWLLWLYENRQMFVFGAVHALLTIVIWAHFAYHKFQVQEGKVPDGVNRYWWKRLLPPLLFGSKHAILLQMALLPLTMCRFSIAQLSFTPLRNFIPFSRITAMHIHLGYTMVSIVFIATIFFFGFFGMLCDEQKVGIEKSPKGIMTYCEKFTSEIMITGLVITGLLLIVAGTSFFRSRMPYEVFYIVHHLVFAMFIVSIVHTFDIDQRKALKDRSQTWTWFSFSLLYYITDRVYMHMSNSFVLDVVEATALSNSDGTGPKMVVLRLRKPIQIQFYPGQYLSLNISNIDSSWHPFSFASGRGEANGTIDFYIQVFGGKSWTNTLWNMAHANKAPAKVTVMGPMGSGLGNAADYTHMIAIGSGTGIVPMISHFRTCVSQLLPLHPDKFYSNKEKRRSYQHEMQTARLDTGPLYTYLASSANRTAPGELLKAISDQLQADPKEIEHRVSKIQSCFRVSSLVKHGRNSAVFKSTMKRAPNVGARSLRGLLLPVFTIYAIACLGLTLSFQIAYHASLTRITVAMARLLEVGSALTLVFFFLNALRGPANYFLTYIDLLVAIIGLLVGWFWEGRWLTGLSIFDQTVYTAFFTYIIARLWSSAVARDDDYVFNNAATSTAHWDGFKLVWATNSAALVANLWPELEKSYVELEQEWGSVRAARVVTVDVYCTEKDPQKKKELEAAVCGSRLYACGALHFCRPSVKEILTKQIKQLTLWDTFDNKQVGTRTLVGYCGNPLLGRMLSEAVAEVTTITKLTSQSHHSLQFEEEFYGQPAAKRKRPRGRGADKKASCRLRPGLDNSKIVV